MVSSHGKSCKILASSRKGGKHWKSNMRQSCATQLVAMRFYAFLCSLIVIGMLPWAVCLAKDGNLIKNTYYSNEYSLCPSKATQSLSAHPLTPTLLCSANCFPAETSYLTTPSLSVAHSRLSDQLSELALHQRSGL